MITYQAEDIKLPAIERRRYTAWIKAVAAHYGKKIGDIAYVFCSDERLLEVNRQFLGHDYFTDIITFDDCEGDILNGDIMISVDTVKRNAVEYGVEYLEELRRVIIHGVLHLTGQNDKTPTDFVLMKQKEDQALAMFKTMQ
ncbi:MAG: rRNA maturation RNase YbeY [Bacteroidales bacterium]|nr:rRNA maturation RNase YbeY [Bacteroidales bacterium]